VIKEVPSTAKKPKNLAEAGSAGINFDQVLFKKNGLNKKGDMPNGF